MTEKKPATRMDRPRRRRAGRATATPAALLRKLARAKDEAEKFRDLAYAGNIESVVGAYFRGKVRAFDEAVMMLRREL